MPGPSALNPLDAPLFVEAELPSTMDAARSRAQVGDVNGTLVLAARQTGGRGRYGNTWASPLGGLYLSLLVRPPDVDPGTWREQHLPWLALRASLGMLQVVRPLLPTPPAPPTQPGQATPPAAPTAPHSDPLGIKWPNDLYLGARKLGGVLVEAGHGPRAAPYAIVGLGLNVRQDPTLLPPTATSLTQTHAAPIPSMAELARAWRTAFYALPTAGPSLIDAVQAHLLGLGTAVTLGWRPEEQTTPEKQKSVSGRLAGLGNQAEAILEDVQGNRITVSEGHLLNWSTWIPSA